MEKFQKIMGYLIVITSIIFMVFGTANAQLSKMDSKTWIVSRDGKNLLYINNNLLNWRSLDDNTIVVYPYATQQNRIITASKDGEIFAIVKDRIDGQTHKGKPIYVPDEIIIFEGDLIKTVDISSFYDVRDEDMYLSLSFDKDDNLYIGGGINRVFKYCLETGKVKEIIIDKDVGIFKGYVEELNSPIYTKAIIQSGSYFYDRNNLFYVENNKKIKISLSDTNNHKAYWSQGQKIGKSFWEEQQRLIGSIESMGIRDAVTKHSVYQLNDNSYCFKYMTNKGWNTILYIQGNLDI